MPIPRAPFPSFALVLAAESSQSDSQATSTATLDTGEIRERPKKDLMKTYDPRLDADNWNMRTMDTEEKSETDTIFEVYDDEGKEYEAISDRSTGVRNDCCQKGARRARRRCTGGLVSWLRTLACCGGDTSSL
ncbi:hypothetical protein CPB83DRAFT_854706, partial [Crepidotus variabilis]